MPVTIATKASDNASSEACTSERGITTSSTSGRSSSEGWRRRSVRRTRSSGRREPLGEALAPASSDGADSPPPGHGRAIHPLTALAEEGSFRPPASGLGGAQQRGTDGDLPVETDLPETVWSEAGRHLSTEERRRRLSRPPPTQQWGTAPLGPQRQPWKGTLPRPVPLRPAVPAPGRVGTHRIGVVVRKTVEAEANEVLGHGQGRPGLQTTAPAPSALRRTKTFRVGG